MFASIPAESIKYFSHLYRQMMAWGTPGTGRNAHQHTHTTFPLVLALSTAHRLCLGSPVLKRDVEDSKENKILPTNRCRATMLYGYCGRKHAARCVQPQTTIVFYWPLYESTLFFVTHFTLPRVTREVESVLCCWISTDLWEQPRGSAPLQERLFNVPQTKQKSIYH